jgi:hypothetical protein
MKITGSRLDGCFFTPFGGHVPAFDVSDFFNMVKNTGMLEEWC